MGVQHMITASTGLGLDRDHLAICTVVSGGLITAYGIYVPWLPWGCTLFKGEGIRMELASH